MNISEEQPKKHIEWTKARDIIENNWKFQEGSVIYNPDQIDEMAIGIAGEIDDFIQSLLKQKVMDLIESLGLIKRSDILDWAYNKNEVVEDKIREIFEVKA